MTGYSILLIKSEEQRGGKFDSALLDGFEESIEVTRVDALFDGLRTIQERSFDLIITDLFLPDGQGLATVRHLNQQAPKTPVIVLCSARDRDIAVNAVRKGAHDFFCYEDLEVANVRRSITRVLKNADGEKVAGDPADRRTNARFPCRLAVSYQALEHPFFSGVATSETLNISSKGLLFSTTEPLQPGQLLQVSVDWPARLENEIPLKLVAEGRIVRIVDGLAAMHIDKYEFRTRRAKTQPAGNQKSSVNPASASSTKTSSTQINRPQVAEVDVSSQPGTAAGNKTNGGRVRRNV